MEMNKHLLPFFRYNWLLLVCQGFLDFCVGQDHSYDRKREHAAFYSYRVQFSTNMFEHFQNLKRRHLAELIKRII